MTARSRLLAGVNSPPPPSSQDTSPSSEPLDGDFVVILAALLCALICVLGLVAVARCTWIRRLSGGASSAPASAPSAPAAANKGLKKKVLKGLPKHTYGEDEEQAEKLSDCAICLAEFAAGEEIRVLPQCGHGFHVACIDMWLGSHSSCPSCRQILLSSWCHKCGGVPAASSSGGGAQPEASECRANSAIVSPLHLCRGRLREDSHCSSLQHVLESIRLLIIVDDWVIANSDIRSR